MRYEMEELLNECDELMEIYTKQLINMNAIKSMDGDILEAVQKFISLYEKSRDISIKMAGIIDEQNYKLDRIIELLEKRNEVEA